MNKDAFPDVADMQQAALNYLARYASTETGVRRFLHRRLDRLATSLAGMDADHMAAARAAIETVVTRLLESGVINDNAFAQTRARTLVRGGLSRRSVQARLRTKGVAIDIARQATPEDADDELAAALVMARRRRIGPYRGSDVADPALKLKEMARLARAGFSREVAQRALDMVADEAEARIRALRL